MVESNSCQYVWRILGTTTTFPYLRGYVLDFLVKKNLSKSMLWRLFKKVCFLVPQCWLTQASAFSPKWNIWTRSLIVCSAGRKWPCSLMKNARDHPWGNEIGSLKRKRTIRYIYWGFIPQFCLLACRAIGKEPITRSFCASTKWTNCWKEDKQLFLCPRLLKCVSSE